MLKKISFIGLFIGVTALSALSARSVSFLVIETGLTTENYASRHSALWEDSLMDYFFESGFIVSNAPKIRLLHTPDAGFPYEAEKDFEDAIEGGMHYFIIAIVAHPAPHNVSLRLFRTGSQEMIYEHLYTDRIYRTLREETEEVMSNIRNIATRLQ